MNIDLPHHPRDPGCAFSGDVDALNARRPHRRDYDLLPLAVLPAAACAFRDAVAPWVFMWLMAVALFAGFKWWAWKQALRAGMVPTPARSLAFLFLWPGMDARRFLAGTPAPGRRALTRAATFAVAKTLFGAALLWGAARLAGHGLAAGWIGMIGFVFVLHFGIFHLLAVFWQARGIDAAPIMRWPLLAESPGDFWGRRWNAGFRDLAFGLLFTRLAAALPPRAALMAVFLVSGLLHELVITLPARADYGLPTAYFLLQGLGLLAERSPMGRRLHLRRGMPGRMLTFALVVLPIGALFPPPFVTRVMVPFFHLIGALS